MLDLIQDFITMHVASGSSIFVNLYQVTKVCLQWENYRFVLGNQFIKCLHSKVRQSDASKKLKTGP